jgi:hypothetical protein
VGGGREDGGGVAGSGGGEGLEQATAQAKAIDPSLRTSCFTTAFGRAVLVCGQAMKPEAKASGYLLCGRGEGRWRRPLGSWWKRFRQLWWAGTLGVLRCAQDDTVKTSNDNDQRQEQVRLQEQLQKREQVRLREQVQKREQVRLREQVQKREQLQKQMQMQKQVQMQMQMRGFFTAFRMTAVEGGGECRWCGRFCVCRSAFALVTSAFGIRR